MTTSPPEPEAAVRQDTHWGSRLRAAVKAMRDDNRISQLHPGELLRELLESAECLLAAPQPQPDPDAKLRELQRIVANRLRQAFEISCDLTRSESDRMTAGAGADVLDAIGTEIVRLQSTPPPESPRYNPDPADAAKDLWRILPHVEVNEIAAALRQLGSNYLRRIIEQATSESPPAAPHATHFAAGAEAPCADARGPHDAVKIAEWPVLQAAQKRLLAERERVEAAVRPFRDRKWPLGQFSTESTPDFAVRVIAELQERATKAEAALREEKSRGDALSDQIGDIRDAAEAAPDESPTAFVRDLRLRAEKAEAALAEAQSKRPKEGTVVVETGHFLNLREAAEVTVPVLERTIRVLAKLLAEAPQP